MASPYRVSSLEEEDTPGHSRDLEDNQPLIEGYGDVEEDKGAYLQLTRSGITSWVRKPFNNIWLLHGLVFLLYTAAFLLYTKSTIWSLSSGQEGLVYSPIRAAFGYEARVVNTTISHHNDFTGPPGPNIDQAWKRILGHEVHLRLTETDLGKLKRSSVPLTDIPGTFLGSPDIYHQLHCVYTLYRAIHPEYYDGEANKEATITPVEHLDHCINQLREYLQCHVSSSVYTYRWEEEKALMTGNFDPENECVDWLRFDEWIRSHSVDISRPGLLVHPRFGPLYSD